MDRTDVGPGAEDVERFGYRQELKRSLSTVDLLVYGLIFMVPIAPFGLFGFVYNGSGGMVALAYVVGMVASAGCLLALRRLRAMPDTGSTE